MDCLICKKNQLRLVTPTIYRCDNCGSLIRDKDIDYKKEYIDINYHFDFDWLTIEQKGKALYVKEDLKENSKNCLEVGACWGDLIEEIRKSNKSIQTYCLEIKKLKREEYKKTKEIICPFEEIKSKIDVKFDNIIMNDVIEHLNSPRDSLLLCNRILNNKGKLILFTDDADNQLFGTLGMVLHPEHRFITGKKGIESLAKSAGFKIIKYYNLLFSYAIYAVLEKEKEL